ncbi:MAG: hypothetical protein AABZ30_08320 [Myxococcota bacterium]
MPRLVRKSYFVEPAVLRKLTRAVGARSEAEAIRLVARWYVESEAVKAHLRRTAGSLRPDEIDLDGA